VLGVYVTIPVACFRKGMAREFLETEAIPPPATCYGFLLSLVGETQRARHVGARVTPTLLNHPVTSVVLRTVWRIKKRPLGSPGNTRPDYQQLLTGTELLVWVNSSGEKNGAPRLEERVRESLDPETRNRIKRFGGLSLGESTHLVDSVALLSEQLTDTLMGRLGNLNKPRTYMLAEKGLLGLPVWVDHVGSAGTVHVVGELVKSDRLEPPPVARMPRILPPAAES